MKKTKNRWLLAGLFLLPLVSLAQSLTLDSAFEMAKRNYPLIRQRDLIQKTTQLTIENLNKGYLPQVSINGQASYQSDVTQVSVPIPGINIPSPSKDQYKITADVSQMVYDGGLTKTEKITQGLNEAVEQQKIEVELYKLRDRINQLFLGVLLFDKQIGQAALAKKDIDIGVNKTEAMVNNGVAFRSNLNTLKAEALKADQRLIELRSNRESLIKTLSLFIGKELPANTVLEEPSSPMLSKDIARPELQLYSKQSKLIDEQKKLIYAKNIPKASLFFQGGYGRPALNLLKNEFDWFYITGVRLNWSLGGLYTFKNDKRIVEANSKAVDIQKDIFLLNTNSQLIQQQSDINKYTSLVASDKEIIELRESVKTASLAQLQNGVITSNDYLRDVNAEDQARLTLITHQLQLLQAQINYQTITGK
jgi:outer membrane protein TolC